jgi:iron(III) transport system ATP-binding protein
MRLRETRPEDANGHAVLQAQVTRRVYLGETWDYLIRPRDSAIELRVSAPPTQVHEVGQAVWLTLDPQQVVIVD